MQTVNFTATDDADFAALIEVTDNTTNAAFDLTAYEATFQVTDCGTAVLTAKTEDATLDRVGTNGLQFRFTRSQMAALCPGNTYKCGCIIEDGDGFITQVFVGTLALIDGGLA